jgi:hypothetical protein
MDAREFYADPAIRLAAEAMRQGRGIGQSVGVPKHEGADAYGRALDAQRARQVAAAARRRRSVAQVPGTAPVRQSRQVRAARAGRPVQPLPTRTARRVRRAQRRLTHRLGLAAPAALIVLVALLFVIPAVAAVTLGLSVGAMVLGYAR